jgi:hydroxymethylglutaryl-CoA lyase
MSDVTIVEVAPRDGFQAVKQAIPTERKLEVIRALVEAGFERIEIGAFVSPKALPQMADIGEILDQLSLAEGLRPAVLVPNRKGFELALGRGLQDIVYVLSVSEAHNRANVRRSVEESFAELTETLTSFKEERLRLRLNLATCFHCPYEGHIDPERVLTLVERAAELDDRIELNLCDTTGRAAPNEVQSLFEEARQRLGEDGPALSFHGHDTYNLGIANAVAAYRGGARVFDAAAAGLGGCPFAPGATGNTATEDLVFAFELMGISTGIDLDRLLSAAELAAGIEGGQAGGRVRLLPRKNVLAGLS